MSEGTFSRPMFDLEAADALVFSRYHNAFPAY